MVTKTTGSHTGFLGGGGGGRNVGLQDSCCSNYCNCSHFCVCSNLNG